MILARRAAACARTPASWSATRTTRRPRSATRLLCHTVRCVGSRLPVATCRRPATDRATRVPLTTWRPQGRRVECRVVSATRTRSATGRAPRVPWTFYLQQARCVAVRMVSAVWTRPCDGSSASCPEDEFAPATTECRPSAGVCDAAESCDGISAALSSRRRLRQRRRRAAPRWVTAIVAESCDGVTAECPADVVAPVGECRGSAGDCDVAESCDG